MVAPPTYAGPGYVSPNGNGSGVFAFVADIKQARREKKAGALISEGKCDEARTLALKAGDLDLAKRVAEVCASQ